MAVTIDKADVLLVAPELSVVTDPQWDAILASVGDEVGVVTFGTQARADRAGVQLAAHLATKQHIQTGAGGAAGPLVSVTVGPVTKAFAQPQKLNTSVLATTKYGLEYLRLVYTFGRRMQVT